jgi:hypothetical protein
MHKGKTYQIMHKGTPLACGGPGASLMGPARMQQVPQGSHVHQIRGTDPYDAVSRLKECFH